MQQKSSHSCFLLRGLSLKQRQPAFRQTHAQNVNRYRDPVQTSCYQDLWTETLSHLNSTCTCGSEKTGSGRTQGEAQVGGLGGSPLFPSHLPLLPGMPGTDIPALSAEPGQRFLGYQ